MAEPDDFTPEDPLPAITAAIDQAGSMAPLIATLAKSHYDAYVAVGFFPKQALYLTAVQLQESPGTAP